MRRLGLSPTVAAQIQRYRHAADKGGSVELEETISVLRLIGRRSDAPLVFADAGRRAARYAARNRARSSRTLARVSPGGMARRLGAQSAARVSRRIFGGELRPRPYDVEVRDDGAAFNRSAAHRRGLRLLWRGLSGAAPGTHGLRGSADPPALPVPG